MVIKYFGSLSGTVMTLLLLCSIINLQFWVQMIDLVI